MTYMTSRGWLVIAALSMYVLVTHGQAQTPVISEFLASNGSTLPLGKGHLLDEDGDSADWLELFNPTDTTVNLEGWYLTDDAQQLTQWRMPSVLLPSGQFLVVFASGKDRRDPTQTLHTNFKLGQEQGGFLALVQPDGQTLASSYAYAPQRRDVSYGITEVGSLKGEILIPERAPVVVGLPTPGSADTVWTTRDFDDSQWAKGETGVGYGYETLVRFDMRSIRSLFPGIYLRLAFEVSDTQGLARLALRMKYDDGFVAYLNGVPVARAQAPDDDQLTGESHATAQHSGGQAETFELFPLPAAALEALVIGRNVLAIHALNADMQSDGFLALPELWAQRAEDISDDHPHEGYMAQPTPGSANHKGTFGFVQDVTFSRARGFHPEPFTLNLETETSGAEIRYTLDGSTPSATHGQVYEAPFTIDSTTVVRAGGFKRDYLDGHLTTHSYLFVRDVVVQSPQGQRPGPAWPQGNVNGQAIDYGMDPDVVDDPRWADTIEETLLAIPSLSLVTDIDNLFGASNGIYVHARNDGPEWERRISAELIHPDETPGFALDAGLRIRGAFSRSNSNPKHSFRLFFRNEYGAGKLDYPLFGGEGALSFDKIDLRTSQNNSWAFEGSNQNTLIRDVFSRDVQHDMGQPYTRSRYIHLYLNGQYWGIYQTQERADGDFAAAYLGGKAADYDVIKNNSSGSRALHPTNGTMDAYRRLYDAAVAGFTTDAAYHAVQGLHPDGTPDPDGERLLDSANLMDYMICTYYTGDPDAPVSCWAHFSNNVFTIYNRVEPAGFTWYRHDAEHSLGANGGLQEGRLLTDPVDRMIGREWRHFNPAWLHVRLCEHPDYRRDFADRVSRALTNGGLLTAEANTQRWSARARQIEQAIVAESARWGDAQRSTPRTQQDWQQQNDYMIHSYFPYRAAIVINQMRSVDMFPPEALVFFNQPGGAVPPGFELHMSQREGLPGTLLYTLDGTDPRAENGDIAPSAMVYEDETLLLPLVERGATWRYLDNGSDQGTAWRDPGFNDTAWPAGAAPLGYGDGDEQTVVNAGPNGGGRFVTTYFRYPFTVEESAGLTELTLGLVRDDGAVVYLNGEEVVRTNMPADTIDYLTWAEGPGVPVGGGDESSFNTYALDPATLRQGTNVMAVEIHQVSATSSDISFDLELTGLIARTTSSPILLNQSTVVKARVQRAQGWGALAEARFTVGRDGLVINEFMAVNRATLEDPAEAGEFPDWIELYNGGTEPIDLGGLFLTDDLQQKTQWQFAPGMRLEAGAFLILYADSDDAQGVDHTNFKLDGLGETLALIDDDGETVLDRIVFDQQREDVSYARFPDGSDTWEYHVEPTPGTPNGGPGTD